MPLAAKTPEGVVQIPGSSGQENRHLCHDYCNSLYLGLPKKILQRLQLIQNAAARLLMGFPLRDLITHILCALHWLPVYHRILFKASCIKFKTMRSLAPS